MNENKQEEVKKCNSGIPLETKQVKEGGGKDELSKRIL